MTDAFTNGARQLIVGPRARACLRVGSDIAGHDAPGEPKIWQHLTRASLACRYRFIALEQVMFRMAVDATARPVREIASTL